MKRDLKVILLVLVFFLGLALMLYPTLADYWNQRTQSQSIVDYEFALQDLGTKDFEDMFEAADAYNEQLRRISNPFVEHEKAEGYNETLNVLNHGMMGYISIKKIGVELPIYHGTSSSVLNFSIGHLEGSSLPVGGKGTHSVLSGHRGLPSARLFTDLDKLEIGDTFSITILDRMITYEVDQILIVEPTDISALNIINGEDHCTLFTCTPYGINTQRLLVRGTRTETHLTKPVIYVKNEAYRINPVIVAPAVAVPMLLLLLVGLMVRYGKKKRASK